ncbi:MAG: helix-turn-helix domain-containing protein [Terriglobia bacterium]
MQNGGEGEGHVAYDGPGLFASIQERLNSKPRIGLSTLSSELKVSRHTIERCVRAATGKSFRKLSQRMLLRKSKETLANRPNFSIKEIASLFDYRFPRSFSRFVRQATGHSPIELRRLNHIKKKNPARMSRSGRNPRRR